MPVDPLFFEDRLKLVAGAAHGFRGAEKQDAAFAQGKMEQREDFLLNLGAQIDEKVAAAYEVEARERCIGDQIMDREDNRRTQLARHPIALSFLGEETGQPCRRHVALD
jgi:hypothetical protein